MRRREICITRLWTGRKDSVLLRSVCCTHSQKSSRMLGRSVLLGGLSPGSQEHVCTNLMGSSQEMVNPIAF